MSIVSAVTVDSITINMSFVKQLERPLMLMMNVLKEELPNDVAGIVCRYWWDLEYITTKIQIIILVILKKPIDVLHENSCMLFVMTALWNAVKNNGKEASMCLQYPYDYSLMSEIARYLGVNYEFWERPTVLSSIKIAMITLKPHAGIA